MHFLTGSLYYLFHNLHKKKIYFYYEILSLA